MLDDEHLVAWSDLPRRRLAFAASLASFLESMRDTEVCVFYGRFISDLESFCHQLERAIPGEPLERRIDGRHGVTALLRSRQELPGCRPTRLRYIIWHDADMLVKQDHALFGRLVDAMVGVAAEHEYASDDLLLVQRTIFIGGPVLNAYADDPKGQFRSWYPDGLGEPFWEVVTGIEAPPTRRLWIDTIQMD